MTGDELIDALADEGVTVSRFARSYWPCGRLVKGGPGLRSLSAAEHRYIDRNQDLILDALARRAEGNARPFDGLCPDRVPSWIARGQWRNR